MKLTAILAGAALLAASSAVHAAEPADAHEPVPMMRGLGVGTHFGRNANWDVDKLLPLLKGMGVSVIRDGPEWAGIEQEKGKYEIPAGSQHIFDVVTQSGIKIIYPIFRKNPAYENPLDPDAAAQFAAFMASKWQPPQVAAYEVWNEPVNFDFPQQYGRRNWLPKYWEMVEKVAAAIKKVQPKAVVLENEEGMQFVDAMRDHPAYFAQLDGVDLHPYPKRNPPESGGGRPSLVDAQHSMASYLHNEAWVYPEKYLGRKLEIWVGEYGYPTMSDPGGQWMGVTEPVQAAYQVRGLLTGLHAGAKAWCIYDFVNEGTNPKDNEDNMGLLHDASEGYKPKPAYYALQRVARLMGMDWQIADVPAKLAVDARKLGVAKDVPDRPVVMGPQLLWYRVGDAYVAYVWNAGWYVDQAQVPTGTITWAKAPRISGVTAQDLVTGEPLDVKLKQTDGQATLSGVPVGSDPVAIRVAMGP